MVKESEYQQAVAAWLAESFADVEYKPYLDSGRIPDFIARTPFESYVIEVENEWEPYMGIGQAEVYAAESGHEPVVVFPADEVDPEDFSLLSGVENVPRLVTV